MDLQSHFRKAYILASSNKSNSHTYLPKTEAMKKDFIQFNALAITMLSVDIDNCDIFALQERLKSVPTPSIIVETDSGFHIHYALTYPISYKKGTLVTWSNHIRTELTKLVGGDKCAVGLKRLYRNPKTHSTVYTDVSYQLSDFGIDYPKRTFKRTGRPVYNYDFSTVVKGERHTALFNYLRTYAYSNSTMDSLEEVLTFLADESNSQMPEPLTLKHIESLVTSIMKFMSTYTGRKEQTEFNRTLAKNKHKALVIKATNVLKELQLKKVKLLSNRAIARACSIAPSTVGLHREEIINILINICLVNIKLSLEEYKKLNGEYMVYEFKCTEDKCGLVGKPIQVTLSIKDYEEEVKKLSCAFCNSPLRRHYTSPSINTFGDGYKSSVS